MVAAAEQMMRVCAPEDGFNFLQIIPVCFGPNLAPSVHSRGSKTGRFWTLGGELSFVDHSSRSVARKVGANEAQKWARTRRMSIVLIGARRQRGRRALGIICAVGPAHYRPPAGRRR